jgi:hypothetical protein
MAPINEALADLESREEDKHFAIQTIADHHGVNCSTLGQRWMSDENAQYCSGRVHFSWGSV